MSAEFDVAARLADGQPAVDRFQQYVWACHVLGYQHPDLTAHPAQVRDWYGAEEGLDLRALDADCAALAAAAAAVEQALALQQDQLVALASSWQGRGADASREFLGRHGEASAAAVAALHTAADALAALRDQLWQAVDGKVAAVQAIDGRSRADWLAAAHTVIAGTGDRSAASELLDQQVKPFVDNDIRVNWLAAVRATTASVTTAYDDAIAALEGSPATMFTVPEGLGPVWQSSPVTDIAESDDDRVAPFSGSWAVPSGAAPAGGWAPSVPSWTPPPTGPSPDSWAPAVAPTTPAAATEVPQTPPAAAAPALDPVAPPALPSMGGLGGGLPDIGTGFSGLGQQLADMLSGLVGSDGELPDPPELDESELDQPDLDALEDDTGTDDEEAPDEDDTDKGADNGDELVDGVPDQQPEEVEEPVVEPPVVESPVAEPVPEAVPTPAPVPPPTESTMPLAAPAPPETPCEIAADELPQVGQ